jgi:Flp pilus assembly protein TadD
MNLRRFFLVVLLSAEPLLAQSADAELSFQRALELHRAGDFQGAIEHYLLCLRGNPNNVEARSNLGAALARVGRYAEAVEHYKVTLGRAARFSSAAMV